MSFVIHGFTKLHSITFENKKIPVWQYGDAKNPAILFIHGYPLAFSEYAGSLPIEYLQQHYCIYTFDLPRFGASQHIQDDPIQYIHHLVTTLLSGKKIVLFGTSFGGIIALSYAVLFPKQIAAVIISGTPWYPLPSWMYIVCAKLISFFHPRFASVVKQFAILPKKSLTAFTRPVLLLYSTNDRIGTVEMGKHFEKLLPQATLVAIHSRSHTYLLHRVDQNAFLPAIQRFLAEIYKNLSREKEVR